MSSVYSLVVYLFARLVLYEAPVKCNNITEGEEILLRTLAASDGPESVINRDNVDLDRDLVTVCNILRDLDVNLTMMVKDLPVGGGKTIKRLLRIYNQACLDLLFLCTKDKLKVLNAAEDILQHGGPKMFDVNIDEKKMADRFLWSENKMDEFNDILKKTYEHWNDLWFINNNFPSFTP